MTEQALEKLINAETAKLRAAFLEQLKLEIEKARGDSTLVVCLCSQNPRPDYFPTQQAQLSISFELLGVLQEAQIDGIAAHWEYENIGFICRGQNRSDYAGKVDKAIELVAAREFGRMMPQRKIAVNFGLASFPHDSEHPEQLMQQAFLALKAAQEAGPNKMGCFWMLKSTPFPPVYP